jgi:hypothetical protein
MKKLYILTLFFLLPINAHAELTHPYSLDIKPQVLFGDSVSITDATTTYKGLENYHQDYVAGFAHFTFTYTHSFCCFAGYPPLVYVTDVDPRTTFTPVQKILYPAYNIPSFSGIPTDWYSYDIQFDATGYTTIVKEATTTNEIYHAHQDGVVGMTGSDWVSIVNYFPLYNPVSAYSMAFTPVPVKQVQNLNPVIIIPGIMGSIL